MKIMKIILATIVTVLIGLVGSGCVGNTTSEGHADNRTQTEYQKQLISEGWHKPNEHCSGELPVYLGIRPKYGQYDNYFDIEMGRGCDVVIKIIDKATDECIRYVYVHENSMENIQMIPQGVYYLKLAYGRDWMEFENEDGTVIGKFTDNVSYEKSIDTFDFGLKNSSEIISNILRINVKDEQRLHNFTTIDISESEFMK